MSTVNDATIFADEMTPNAKTLTVIDATHQSRLHEQQQHLHNQTPNDALNVISGKRVYFCQRCLNHGILAPRKNHKCECIHAHCNCSKCILVERRRVLNTQLHELEENEHQQQQHIQPQLHKLNDKHDTMILEQNESSRQQRLQNENEAFVWKNTLLYDTLNELQSQQIRQQYHQPPLKKQEHEKTNFETLQTLLLNGIFNNNNHNQQQCNQEEQGKKSAVVSNNTFQVCKLDSLNDYDSSAKHESDLFNDELHSFRSRISTVNSVKSTTTTNSSLTSGSSSTTSPTDFGHFEGGTLFKMSDLQSSAMIESSLSNLQCAFAYNPRMKGERVPNCQKCGQHGLKSRLKGHKRYCPFKSCTCAKCQVITERQRLMADQIKIRRRQCKDTMMRLKRERMVSDTIAANNRPDCIDVNGDASRFSFSTADMPAINGANTLSASYLNTLNVLCRQFTSAPMMLTPSNIAPSVIVDAVTTQQQRQNDQQTQHQQHAILSDRKTSLPVTIDKNLVNVGAGLCHANRRRSNFVAPTNTNIFSASSDFMRLLAEKSGMNLSLNDINTITTASSTICSNKALNSYADTSVFLKKDDLDCNNDKEISFNNENDKRFDLIQQNAESFYTHSSDKCKADSFLKFIQQRHLLSDIMLNKNPQQQYHHYHKEQQQQQHILQDQIREEMRNAVHEQKQANEYDASESSIATTETKSENDINFEVGLLQQQQQQQINFLKFLSCLKMQISAEKLQNTSKESSITMIEAMETPLIKCLKMENELKDCGSPITVDILI